MFFNTITNNYSINVHRVGASISSKVEGINWILSWCKSMEWSGMEWIGMSIVGGI